MKRYLIAQAEALTVGQPREPRELVDAAQRDFIYFLYACFTSLSSGIVNRKQNDVELFQVLFNSPTAIGSRL